MSQRAIIVVDIQNEYFPSGKLPLVGIEAAAANAARVIQAARAEGDTVINIRHEFPDPQAPIFTPGSSGVEIHPAVVPQDGEAVILKHSPNAFRETDLKQRLDAEGVEDVVVVGAMSHVCIDATSRAAADFGYRVTIVHDACATQDVEFEGLTVPAAQAHATIMAALAFAYGTVTTTGDFLAA
ncbi:cysteine hydrolase family protein [Halomonas organivorans]|uniref:Nicotinamidase-related amidase n=1 Tax=Halomonas organivorans TaxID=257772 RepID=A0A7W5BX02_9GAMM|nr:cysteine hydrolase family protein [Halomonas organivorans]MBB3139678.1 nicotinamidase-related amidase [Halomonas organivorans]